MTLFACRFFRVYYQLTDIVFSAACSGARLKYFTGGVFRPAD